MQPTSRRLLLATKADADAFEAELSYLLVNQYGAFKLARMVSISSLWHEYGIAGSGGNWAWQADTRTPSPRRKKAYERPQCSACFIQAVKDDLMSIYELVKSEARLFKYGSGTGSDFTRHPRQTREAFRGGTSLWPHDRFSKCLTARQGPRRVSGGTTRRAAKMVCPDMDHPEIVDFINWKSA